MVQGTPPGSAGPPGQYPPGAEGLKQQNPGIGGVHGFAPPAASLPSSVSKGSRGPLFGALVALGALVFLGAIGTAGFLAYERYARTPEPAATVTGVKLPDWAPVFPGSTTLESQLVPTGEDRADGTVTLLAQEPLQNALNFYRVALKRKGLTVTALSSGNDRFSIEAKSKSGAEKLVVAGTRDAAVTQLVLMLSTRHRDKDEPYPGDELPSYLKLIDGAKVTQQVTRAAKSRAHGFIKFESTKAAAALLDFYERKLKAAGFDVSRDSALVSAEKNSIDVAKVIVAESGGKRRVTLIAKAE